MVIAGGKGELPWFGGEQLTQASDIAFELDAPGLLGRRLDCCRRAVGEQRLIAGQQFPIVGRRLRIGCAQQVTTAVQAGQMLRAGLTDERRGTDTVGRELDLLYGLVEEGEGGLVAFSGLQGLEVAR